jgi:RNAse (barnase) inhibitor barstar
MDNEPFSDIVTIDCKNVKTINELHELLAEELLFPSFYGNNWDAFWDAITGLVEMPLLLTITNYSYIESKFSKDWEIFKKCLSDMNKEYPNINCRVMYS